MLCVPNQRHKPKTENRDRSGNKMPAWKKKQKRRMANLIAKSTRRTNRHMGERRKQNKKLA